MSTILDTATSELRRLQEVRKRYSITVPSKFINKLGLKRHSLVQFELNEDNYIVMKGVNLN